MLKLEVRKVGCGAGERSYRPAAGRRRRFFPVEAPAGAWQLRAYDPAFEKKMKTGEGIIRRYRNTLHALAK